MNEHIDEAAELYAVGSLDETGMRRVDEHAAHCAICAKRLDDAETTVAEIAQALPQYQPSKLLRDRVRASTVLRPRIRAAHRWLAGIAIAAALAIAFIPAWVAVDRTRVGSQTARQDDQALARIASETHLSKAAFVAAGRKLSAAVLYGSAGNWYYVVVMHPAAPMQVAYVHAGRLEMLGRVAMHGQSGTLFLPIDHRMDELALVENDTVIARAHLAY